MPSFEHGSRGWQTSSTTVPIRQRSPMSAPETSTPCGRQVLAEHAVGELAVEMSSHQSMSSRAYA